MEVMWLLIPLSAVLVLLVIAVFAWALHHGQFEDLEHEGTRILLDEAPQPTSGPAPRAGAPEQLSPSLAAAPAPVSKS